MPEDMPPAGTPKLTLEEQAEAYERGTPGFRRALWIMFIVIWVVVIGVILLLVFVFHKPTVGGGGRGIGGI